MTAETHHRIAAVDFHIEDGVGTVAFRLEAVPASDPDVIDHTAIHADIRAALRRWLETEETNA